ncbi:MAG: P-loop NTPase fold protein [Alphaproteobacteria bacterium]
MSLENIKKSICNFLRSDDTGILLIRGKWGVGKTHLWNEALKECGADIKIPICYQSLFGITSLHEVKFGLATQLLLAEERWEPKTSKLGKYSDTAKSALRWTRKGTGKFGGAVEALMPAMQKALALSAFNALDSAVICFDDLERKNPSLTMNELLGLATLLRDEKQCKVVFILNTDMLDEKDRDDLQRYKEKIVDIDLLLEPSPEECIHIAAPELQEEENAVIRASIQKLNISNIRIIRRILRQWRELKAHLPSSHFHQTTINSAASSLCLFSWAYYGTAENKPDVEFLKKYQVWNDKENADAQVQIWRKLLEDYGYQSTDELDLEIESFVRTGFINDNLFTKADALNQGVARSALESEFSKAWDIYHDSFQDDVQLVLDTLFEAFKRCVIGISPGNLNGVVRLFKELSDPQRAQQMIDYYMEQRGDELELFDMNERSISFFEEPQPEVLAAFENHRLRLEQSDTSTLESLIDELVKERSLRSFKERRLISATVDEYYAYFKSLSMGAYKAVRACLQYAPYNDDKKIIAVNAAKALERISAESALQARRVAQKLGRNHSLLQNTETQDGDEESLEAEVEV